MAFEPRFNVCGISHAVYPLLHMEFSGPLYASLYPTFNFVYFFIIWTLISSFMGNTLQGQVHAHWFVLLEEFNGCVIE